jgi:hypothetical protein
MANTGTTTTITSEDAALAVLLGDGIGTSASWGSQFAVLADECECERCIRLARLADAKASLLGRGFSAEPVTLSPADRDEFVVADFAADGI